MTKSIMWRDASSCLWAEYEVFDGRYSLKGIKLQAEESITEIALSSIWINGLPAEDLKWIRSSRMPEGCERNGEGEIFKLSSKNGWDWYRKDKKTNPVASVKATVIFKGKTRETPPLIGCLKVRGLKKIIYELCDYKDTPYSDYIAFHNGRLPDNYTLHEVGIDKEGTIQVKDKAELKEGPKTLQKATGGSYESTDYFVESFSKIQEKIGIVCALEKDGKGLGTGFLLGKNLIMTSRHVLPNGAEGEKLEGFMANFFYEEKGAKVTVQLEKVICCSPEPPPPFHRPTADALDYVVVSFRIGFQPWNAYNLNCQFKIAENFFQTARVQANTNRTLDKIKEEGRANIIQHPEETIKVQEESVPTGRLLPKLIAYRENRMHSKRDDDYLHHYESKTSNASSGSPVINDQGELIGLHEAKCTELESRLFKAIIHLFTELELGIPQKGPEKYHTFPDDKFLEVYYRGDGLKGLWLRTTDSPDAKKKGLLDLIKERKKFTTDEQAGAYAVGFLNKQGHGITTDHVYCNRAVKVDRIMEDLRKKGKFEELKKEEGFCRDDLTNFIFPGGALLAMVGSVIWFLTKRK